MDFVGVSLILACLALSAISVERIDVGRLLLQAGLEPGTPDVSRRTRRAATRSVTLEDLVTLDDSASLDVIAARTTAQGTRVAKMQERYQGDIVPDGVVTVETDKSGRLLDASGALYRGLGQDLEEEEENCSPQEALNVCLWHNSDLGGAGPTHVKVEKQVVASEGARAFRAYFVQYLVSGQTGGERERRPTCIVKASSGEVTESYDAIENLKDCKAKGTGGNERIGKIHYGEDPAKCLDLRREGDRCFLENKYVKVINNNHTETSSKEDPQDAPAASYNCSEIYDQVNGAYSPLLDALFYGTVVGRMFEDWYNMSALGRKMTFRVHYGYREDNAYWDGFDCLFGDGFEMFYPLVSLDIVGHEVGHGITERFSKLVYLYQWGGINEAFSDMAGETAEAYLDKADWMSGYGVVKEDRPLRWHATPNQDNNSIDSVDDFKWNMNVHFSSGVYNAAFYRLVNVYGVPIRRAFEAFLHANMLYWHRYETFGWAACDVMRAAYDNGQDGAKFHQAFSEVGIEACDVSGHVASLSPGETYKDVTVCREVSPTFTLYVPGAARAVRVTAASPDATPLVLITASNKKWGELPEGVNVTDQFNEYEGWTVYGEGVGHLTLDVSDFEDSFRLTLVLTSDATSCDPDVTLTASYDCNGSWSCYLLRGLSNVVSAFK